MSDDEDELRRHLHDPRWELPVAGDAEERIRQAARRDRRVRFAGALAIVLVLGTAATGYGLSRQSGSLHVITPAGSPAVTPTIAVSPTPASSPEPGARAAIPAGFQAESVTFVSANDGWVLGGACATCAAAILHTADGGRTWAPVPAPAVPLAQAPDASNGGVSSIRFANAEDGWLFGPELWSTHDGGTSWSRPGVPGLSSQYAYVDDLEAANGLATAAILTDGNGISIDTTPVGTDAWQSSPTVLQLGAGPIPGAQVVLQAATGWIVENDRVVIAGARLVNGGWQPWTPPCQNTGGPATLAASSATTLVALCDEGLFGGTNLGEYLNRSTDGGTTFAQLGNKLPYPDMQSLTAAPGSQTIVASAYGTTSELVASFNNGATWQTVYQALAGGSGFTDLGFTTAAQGVAVEGANGPLGTLLMTHDGGHTWTPVTFGSGASPSQ